MTTTAPEIDKTLNHFQRIEQALLYKPLLAATPDASGDSVSDRVAKLAGVANGQLYCAEVCIKHATADELEQLRQGTASIKGIWARYKGERKTKRVTPKKPVRVRVRPVSKSKSKRVVIDDGLPMSLDPVSKELDPERYMFQREAKAEIARRIAVVQDKSLTLREMADYWPDITTQTGGGRHRPGRAKEFLEAIAQVPGVVIVQDGKREKCRYTVKVEDPEIAKRLYAGLGGQSVAEYLDKFSAEITRRRTAARDRYRDWKPDNAITGQLAALVDWLEDELGALKKLL